MENIIYDSIIIGGGPAGYTAAIYLSRALLKTLLIEDFSTMSQLTMTDHIENYPGFNKGISGFDLLTNLKDQAEFFGTQNKIAKVISIEKDTDQISRRDIFIIKTEDNELFKSYSIIAASGARANKLNIPGEKEFTGKGVSYCAICDGGFYKNKHVVAVGGGDTAIQEALYLTKFAEKVTVVHRRDKLRAQNILQKKAFSNPKINFIWDTVIEKVSGEAKVESVSIKNIKNNKTDSINIDGLFVFVGNSPNTDYISRLVDCDDEGYIETDKLMKTSIDGIFAAGDLRNDSYRQITIAAGDGATAALSCEKYLELGH